MTVCEDCGCRVYSLGCVNCNEDAYIEHEFAEELSELRSRSGYLAPDGVEEAGDIPDRDILKAPSC